MRNLGRSLVAALALVVWLGVPNVSGANSFEDAFVDCSYPKTFDLMIMRPVGLVAVGGNATLVLQHSRQMHAVPYKEGRVSVDEVVRRATRPFIAV